METGSRSGHLLLLVRKVDVGAELEVLERPFSSACSTEETREIKARQTLEQLILEENGVMGNIVVLWIDPGPKPDLNAVF